jgi:hypothetical protein
MKKIGLIGGIVLLGVIGLIGVIRVIGGVKSEERKIIVRVTPTPAKVVEMSLAEKPFVSLMPTSGAKELELVIARIKNIAKIEYELTYLSNDLSRGVIGTISLNGESEIIRKLTLGSCSRNVCKYDENVTEGGLSLRLIGAGGATKLTTDFHLQKGKSELSSLDGKFKLTAKLDRNAYYLTMNTLGLPGEFTGQISGEPYGVFTSGSTAVKGAKINLPGDVYGWGGSKWQKVDPENVSALTTWVAAK